MVAVRLPRYSRNIYRAADTESYDVYLGDREKEPESELFPTDVQIPDCLWDGLNYVQSNGAHIQCYLQIPMELATYLRDPGRGPDGNSILTAGCVCLVLLPELWDPVMISEAAGIFLSENREWARRSQIKVDDIPTEAI